MKIVGSSLIAAGLLLATIAPIEAAPCPRDYRPVCAVNKGGVRSTYSNACVARSNRAKILHGGECFGPICLPMVFPVCAIAPNGKPTTYSNLCYAENANAVYVYPGACRP
jgi:hypothetical protein